MESMGKAMHTSLTSQWTSLLNKLEQQQQQQQQLRQGTGTNNARPLQASGPGPGSAAAAVLGPATASSGSSATAPTALRPGSTSGIVGSLAALWVKSEGSGGGGGQASLPQPMLLPPGARAPEPHLPPGVRAPDPVSSLADCYSDEVVVLTAGQVEDEVAMKKQRLGEAKEGGGGGGGGKGRGA